MRQKTLIFVEEKGYSPMGQKKKKLLLVRIGRFYVEGFQTMTWGRALWVIILLKLFILFVVLRIFFFRPALAGQTEQEKQAIVAEALMDR